MNIGFIIRYLEKKRTEEALKYIRGGELHLDIGCGDGIMLKESPCKKTLGFDKKYGDKAEKKLPTFKDKQFDYITMLAVLEHLDEPEFVLRQCCRILKPNGRLIITMNKEFADPFIALFSSNLRDEHNRYLSLEEISRTIGPTYHITEYHTFEFTLNQLVVIRRKSEFKIQGTKNLKSVSVIIPTKDEADTIGLLLDELNAVIETLDYKCEVIVIADHCADRTAEIAASRGAKVYENPDSPGKGRALRFAFEQAKHNIIVMMDGDYSHRPSEIPKFLKEIEKGCGLVIGSRFLGGSDEYTLIRTLGNYFLSNCFNILFGVKVRDALNGYKVFNREIIDDFEYGAKDFEIEIELLANTLKKGYTIREIPSYERRRAGGRLKSRVIIHGIKFLLMILKKKFGSKWSNVQ